MAEQTTEFPVSTFLRGHTILSALLEKGKAHAVEQKIAPAVLLTARLFPDMLPLTRQVQLGCGTATREIGRGQDQNNSLSEDIGAYLGTPKLP